MELGSGMLSAQACADGASIFCKARSTPSPRELWLLTDSTGELAMRTTTIRPPTHTASPLLTVEQTKTHIVPIRDCLQARQQVFVKWDDGAWHDVTVSGNNVGLTAVSGAVAASPASFSATFASKPFDREAFQQTARQNQEQVGQQIMQTWQRMTQKGSLRLGAR